MKLKYESHQHDIQQPVITGETTPLFTQEGIQYGIKETWTIRGNDEPPPNVVIDHVDPS